MLFIVLDKRRSQRHFFFLFLHENIYCWYSLEAPRRGASNEYSQYMFLWRNEKNSGTFWLKKASYLELCLLLCIAPDKDSLNQEILIMFFLFSSPKYVNMCYSC